MTQAERQRERDRAGYEHDDRAESRRQGADGMTITDWHEWFASLTNEVKDGVAKAMENRNGLDQGSYAQDDPRETGNVAGATERHAGSVCASCGRLGVTDAPAQADAGAPREAGEAGAETVRRLIFRSLTQGNPFMAFTEDGQNSRGFLDPRLVDDHTMHALGTMRPGDQITLEITARVVQEGQ